MCLCWCSYAEIGFCCFVLFFFKQKTAYEMRISDWSSDVCSSDLEASLVEAFGPIPVANVSDSMARMDAGGSDLRPMHRDGKLAGPALTVRMRPGDNLMLHTAIDMAQPGDVFV